MKPFLQAWQENGNRAWQWMLRRGVSPRVVQASGVSLGAHCLLFLLIALFPGFLTFKEEALPEAGSDVLEIAFQPSPEEEPATPLEETKEEPVTLPALSAPSSEPVPAQAESPRGIVTQLDPAYLKKTAEAPKDATFIAAHNAEATKGKNDIAHDIASEGTIGFRTSAPEQAGGEEGDEGSIAALGVWNKAVANAIGARWDHYRRSKVDLLRAGSVLIQFSIDAKGKVSDVRVLSNDAGSTNALYAVRSTTEAAIPPIPADRLAKLPGKGKRIEVKYTFTILPNS